MWKRMHLAQNPTSICRRLDGLKEEWWREREAGRWGLRRLREVKKSPRVGQCRCDSASCVRSPVVLKVRILSSHRGPETEAVSFLVITFERMAFRFLRKTLPCGSRYTDTSNSQMKYRHWQVFWINASQTHGQGCILRCCRTVHLCEGLVLSQADTSRGLGSVWGCDLELLETMLEFVQVIALQSSDLVETRA